MKSIKSQIHRYIDGVFTIGIIENWDFNNINAQYPTVHWLDVGCYLDGWFADPFIIDENSDFITLLVEEYRFESGKGRLSQIKVSRDSFKLIGLQPIFELTTHLSFPYVIRHNGNIYVCPENCAANEVAIYKYDGKGLTDKVKILSGKFVDTQIIKFGEYFYAFTSKISPDSNGGSKIYEIFKSTDLKGPYVHFQTIENHKIEERGAGSILRMHNKIIRPTQDCNNGYGKGIVFNRLELDDNGFKQMEIARITARPDLKNGLCLHTFSAFNNIVAVDGFDFPIRTIGKIAPVIYNAKRFLSDKCHHRLTSRILTD